MATLEDIVATSVDVMATFEDDAVTSEDARVTSADDAVTFASVDGVVTSDWVKVTTEYEVPTTLSLGVEKCCCGVGEAPSTFASRPSGMASPSAHSADSASA